MAGPPSSHHLDGITISSRPHFQRLLRLHCRFRPSVPPLSPPPHSYACLCGEILRDPEHILRECRLFYQPRIDTAIDTPHHTLSLRELFNAHPNRLLPIPETTRRRGSTSGLWTAKGQTKGGSGRGDWMTGSGKSHHGQLSPRIHVSIYNDPAPETGTPYLLLSLSGEVLNRTSLGATLT